ncbi:MAG TPA: aspartate/glutamate racemase family protein [Noviherbaspirillum sp.]|uniref:aspartate/glutamate racemase family protein n=1 Tax=Noviherbaspirillum sp. TaxID=1926288 RepID=UPI002B48ADB4|nr:aspartate/glutamate racemase family protein [Noviherbaspirillum sp.]HJV87183.1 aspartate/glutamate racemase family protein [Noviherbaspirillum sp.]
MLTSFNTHPKIGIITGSGPDAGLDLWRKLLRANRAMLGTHFRGDLDAPNVTIFSEPALGLSMELAANDAAVWACLKETAQAMAQRVDYYAIACNTLNYYQPQLEALQLPAKLVSFADTALEFLQAARIQRVALLGARPVIEFGPWSPYRKLAAHVDLEPPDAAVVEQVHQLIYDVKTHGQDAPDIRERFGAILDALQSDTVLLACTELPLIAQEPGRKRTVDVTDLVAHKLARLANTFENIEKR